MGRVGNILGGIAKSSTSLGPLDAVMAGFDYKEGLDQGEDGIRAAAGAAGSTLGGWGGAAAGAAMGTVAIPIPVVGTVVGALAGGALGGFGGGWGADRVDEAVRGNQGARESERNTDRNLATTTAITGGVGAGALAVTKNKNMVNPLQQAQALARNFPLAYPGVAKGASNLSGAAQGMAGTAKNAIGGVAKRVPLRSMGIGGAVLGTVAAVNNATGNPIGGVIDAVTGNAMNLRPDDGPNYNADREAGRYNPSTAAYNAMNDANASAQSYANREDFVFERGLREQKAFMELAHQRKTEYERDKDQRNYQYELGTNQQRFDAEREINFAGLQADQATNRLNAYTQAGANATNQLSAILGARYF